jgi:hypothetical protein
MANELLNMAVLSSSPLHLFRSSYSGRAVKVNRDFHVVYDHTHIYISDSVLSRD